MKDSLNIQNSKKGINKVKPKKFEGNSDIENGNDDQNNVIPLLKSDIVVQDYNTPSKSSKNSPRNF